MHQIIIEWNLTIPRKIISNKKLLQEEDFAILFVPFVLKSSIDLGSSSRYVESRFVDNKLLNEQKTIKLIWRKTKMIRNKIQVRVIPGPFWWDWCSFSLLVGCAAHLHIHLTASSGERWQFGRLILNNKIIAILILFLYKIHAHFIELPDDVVLFSECVLIWDFLPINGVEFACELPCNCFSTASVIEDSWIIIKWTEITETNI